MFIKITSSTNDELRKQIDAGGTNLFLYSFQQTQGRGRNGRTFFSGKGGLYMSKTFGTDGNFLTLMPKISLLVSEVLEEELNVSLKIKWVNDIIYSGKKCCGILCEKYKDYIVAGIGLNVFTKIPAELEDKAVSLLEGRKYDEKFLHSLAEKINRRLDLLYEDENWLERYRKKSSVLGCRCVLGVPDGNKIAEGTAVDFDENGGIILETEKGRETFLSGELSLAVKKTDVN